MSSGRTKRARRVLVAAILLVGLVAIQPRPHTAVAQEPGPPNVLIIVTDDQREGLGVMPEVRRLFVREGRSYPHGFVTTPQCCPSRSSILTGRYVHNHGVVNNTSSRQLDPETTLPYYLHSAGYRTAIFGKFLNRWGLDAPPYFDRWATFFGGRDRYFNATYNVNGVRDRLPGYSTNVLRKKASTFLRRSDALEDATPWMLYITPVAAHSPYQPARRYLHTPVRQWHKGPGVYEGYESGDRSDKPPYIRQSFRGPAAFVRKHQLNTLRSVDDMVEHVFRTIHQLGEDNTIAVYLSDNGILWGEHGWVDKSVPYTESVNVPFLTRWPGHIAPGSVDARLVANIDIAPSVLDAADLAPDGTAFDGRSMLDESWTRNRILLEFFGPERETIVPPWASIRTADYQYIEYYGPDGEVTFQEYYDLLHDPWQLDNPFGDDDPANGPPDEGLHDQLQVDRACAGATCP